MRRKPIRVAAAAPLRTQHLQTGRGRHLRVVVDATAEATALGLAQRLDSPPKGTMSRPAHALVSARIPSSTMVRTRRRVILRCVPPQNYIETSDQGDVVVATVVQTRVVEASNADQFFREVEEIVTSRDVKRLLIDLSQVEYMSSAALGSIIKLHRKLSSDKRRLALLCPRASIRDLFGLTKLDTVLDIHDEQESALRSLRKKRFGLF